MRVRGKISAPGLLLAGVAAVVLALAGCASSGSSKASRVKTAATTPPTTASNVAVNAHGVSVIKGSATGNSPCEKAAPTPASPGQVGAGTGGSNDKATPTEVAASEHGSRGMVVPKTLTRSERQTLEKQMEQAREVANRYPTVKAATAAGYRMSTVFVPCIGAHYTNIGFVGSFNPSTPSELLYDGTAPDAKIVGLSYLVYNANGAPSGFSGPNDYWHQHNANGGLCLKGTVVIGSEAQTAKECEARGGHKTLLKDIWMLHAWIVPGFECSWGTFSGECPELGGQLCGTAWDAPDPKSSKCPPGSA